MIRRSGLLIVGLSLLASMLPAVALADVGANGIYPMVFPVDGNNYYSDTFDACRGGSACPRRHEATDILTYGVKGVPVVAVASGTVRWIGPTCCYLSIEHDDGWEAWYIHLNNDTQRPDGSYTDDGLGYGIADGVVVGARVEAGQVIGWVGDSGNAEGTAPHLHFQLRDPDGIPFNAYLSLRAAEAGPPPPTTPLCPDGGVCDTVAFQDAGGQFNLWADLVANPPTTRFFFGNPGDLAFAGDWDCDGVETPGLYRRSDGYVYLRNSNTQGVADVTFFFGIPGDMAVAGDFNNDGCDTVSIYRPSEARFYVINELGSADGGLGDADYSFLFGNLGDKPFIGDFNGDGIDTIGLHRESTGLVYFRNSNTTGIADFQFIFGNPGDKLTAGDWDGDGDDTVAVYRPSNGMFYIRNSNTQGNADATFPAGTYAGVVALTP